MYLDYWNLREPPFQNVADLRFAYLCAQHHEGLARLLYLVQNRKLGGVLTGPIGIGKSMILELLAEQVRKDRISRYVGIEYLPGKPVGLARQVLVAVGLSEAAQNIEDPMDAIVALRAQCGSLGHTVLTLDEAQTISDPDVYHFLHLMMNIVLPARSGVAASPAFTVILSGYTDMTTLLSQDESICQRLQLAWQLEPLDRTRILEYVQHRIRVAGGDIWVFDREAMGVLDAAAGIPRVINNICDVALMLGYAANARTIGPALMQQAWKESNDFFRPHLVPTD